MKYLATLESKDKHLLELTVNADTVEGAKTIAEYIVETSFEYSSYLYKAKNVKCEDSDG
jgi:hypothetical protein